MVLFPLQERPAAVPLRGAGTAGLEFGDRFLHSASHPAQVAEHCVMGCIGVLQGAIPVTPLVLGGVWRKSLGRKKGGRLPHAPAPTLCLPSL